MQIAKFLASRDYHQGKALAALAETLVNQPTLKDTLYLPTRYRLGESLLVPITSQMKTLRSMKRGES